jgi:PAS domain S-box-containing protein
VLSLLSALVVVGSLGVRVRVWEAMTAPSPLLTSPVERRQAQLMARVLVVITPTFVVLAALSAKFAPQKMGVIDGLIFVAMLGCTIAAWFLNRTQNYLRGTALLSWVGVLAAGGIAFRETDLMRAQASLLFGLTGLVYAAFTLPSRMALRIGAAFCLLATAVTFFHPHLPAKDFAQDEFLVLILSGLTLAGARQRHHQEMELKTREREALVATARMRTTLDSSMDTIAVVDAQGAVVDWGQKGEVMFGWAREHVLGKALPQLVTNEASQTTKLSLALQNPAPSQFELTACTHDGRAFAAEASVSVLQGGGAAVFLRDITERKKTQGHLIETDRMESLGRLVAGVAHELNNPLAFVISNLSTLERELHELPRLPEDTQELLDDTQEGVRRVHRIVSDLVTFGRDDISVARPIDLERPLEFAVQLAQTELRARNVQLTRRYSDADRVMANEARLGQVFLSLVINAAQAIGPDAPKREVTLIREMAGDRVRVQIIDSGAGMTNEVKGQLFTPFFTTKRPGKGVGLGLYVARNIVLALGGTIAVESNLGAGTTVTVELPPMPATREVA